MKTVQHIAIIGGGTAGWMAAAALAHQLPKSYKITLVESETIGTVGVGEATIPAIKKFNQILGIDEADFLRFTKGTFKLGIEFVDWGDLDQSYIHAFGVIGGRKELRPTYQYWLKMKALGIEVPDLDHYSIGAMAARHNRFAHAREKTEAGPELVYAYHFDAGLYARYLRNIAEGLGVERIEGIIKSVELDADSGDIAAVHIDGDRKLSADFFVDCSGMRSLLLGDSLKEPYEDWSAWLICDRAVAMPCAAGPQLYSYTRSKACAAGWQWRIPLQHRFGNGYVFSSAHIANDDAAAALMANLEGEALGDPRFISFIPGKRRRCWVKNCVALGLSGGFIEPLESTAIHLIHMGIRRLISLFPSNGIKDSQIKAFNQQTDFEYACIRDFIIAHYKVTQREDTPFWRYVRHMSVPDSLNDRLELFANMGLYFKNGDELFVEHSWVQVLIGQGLQTDGYDMLVDDKPSDWTATYLTNIANFHTEKCRKMPSHSDFIKHFCG